MTKKQRTTEQEKTQSGTPTGMNNNFILEKIPKLKKNKFSSCF